MDKSTLPETLRRAGAALPPPGPGDEGALLGEIATGIAARIEPLAARHAEVMKRADRLARLLPAYGHLVATTTAPEEDPLERTPAQTLMELELKVSLLECWTRAAEFDLELGA